MITCYWVNFRTFGITIIPNILSIITFNTNLFETELTLHLKNDKNLQNYIR